jgi:6-phosphogluconolactonase
LKYAPKLFFAAFILLFIGANVASPTSNKTSQISTYLIGTYTESRNQGIELLSFNEENMQISSKVIASAIKDPSFLITNRAKTLIFSVEGIADGKVNVFGFNQISQNLTLINKANSFGNSPCYLALDNSDRFLAVANYSSGNFSIYEVDSLGGLHFKQSIQHHGGNTNKFRQENAYVHSMVFHPNGKQLLVADLGADKIYIYDVNFSSKKPIIPANPAYFEVASGTGPRHMLIHPNGKTLYIVHELTGEIGTYHYKNGDITHVKTLSLTTPKFNGDVQAAEVRMSSDGKFVYVSNRGTANDISVFETSKEGDLCLIQQISTGGKTPRNFNISLNGRYLVVANQESDEIRIFKRDVFTGRLTLTDATMKINKPVYVLPLQ